VEVLEKELRDYTSFW